MEEKTTLETKVSIIIPVYNEMNGIAETIRHLRNTAEYAHVEIIVSDGGPGHATLGVLNDADIVKVQSPPGRGKQMNTGAAVASGNVLLFLHADTTLPAEAIGSMLHAVSNGAAAGAFSLSISSQKWALRVIAWCANWRTRLERVPYGDQAQFIRSDVFRELGGFAEIPIMEDVELFRRIREKGLPIVILPGKVTTSSRRWDVEGVLKRTLTNWWLRIRYRFGASPETLARHYRPRDHKADDS